MKKLIVVLAVIVVIIAVAIVVKNSKGPEAPEAEPKPAARSEKTVDKAEVAKPSTSEPAPAEKKAAAARPAVKEKDGDVLVTVMFPEVGKALGNITGFVQSIEPATPDFLTPVVGKALFADGLLGVDLKRPIAILVMNPKKFLPVGDAPMPIVVVVPVTKPEDYLNSVELQLERDNPVGDMQVFVQMKREFDFKAFSNAAPEERVDQDKYTVDKRIPYYFNVIEGNSVAFGLDVHSVAAASGLVAGAGGAEGLISDTKRPDDMVVRVEADVAHLVTIFSNEIEQVKQQFASMAGAMPMQPMGGPGLSPEQTIKLLQMEIDVCLDLAKQLEEVVLDVSVNKESIGITETLVPVAGSFMQEFLAAQTQQDGAGAADGLPADCALALSGKLSGTELLHEPMKKLMDMFMDVMGTEGGPPVKDIMALIEESWGIQEGSFAIGMPLLSGPGLSIAELIEYKDGAEAQAIIRDKMFAPGGPLINMYESLGMSLTYNKNLTQHKGVEIDQFTFDIKSMVNMAPQQQQMIEMMYGQDMAAYSAFIGNRQLISFGKGSDALIKQLIDVAKGDAKSLTDSAQYKAAVADLPAGRMAEGFMSLAALMNSISQMNLPGLAPMNLPVGKPFTVAIVADKTALTGAVQIPSEEIRGIYTTIKNSMGAMMGGPMGPGMAPMPMPPAPAR